MRLAPDLSDFTFCSPVDTDPCCCASDHAYGVGFFPSLFLGETGSHAPGACITRQLGLVVRQDFLHRYNGHTCQAEELPTSYWSCSCGFGAVFGQEWCPATLPEAWADVALCRNLTLLELFLVMVVLKFWDV